jgi:hypothetical protein
MTSFKHLAKYWAHFCQDEPQVAVATEGVRAFRPVAATRLQSRSRAALGVVTFFAKPMREGEVWNGSPKARPTMRPANDHPISFIPPV